MKNSIYSKGLIVLACLALAACAKPIPQEVTYIEATKMPEPEPKKEVVEVYTPLPMPGQLKPLPEVEVDLDKTKPAARPWEVIQKANQEAAQGPNEYGYFNAIMQYVYTEGALYQVYTAPFRLTNIQLQPGERLLGKPQGGDTKRWILGKGKSKENGIERVHIYIKPIEPKLHTTIAINTDRRTYLLEVHSYNDTYMAAVNWRYPQDEMAALEAQWVEEAEVEKVTTATHINLDQISGDYQVKVVDGKPAWTPVHVFDDGAKTFIQFPPRMKNMEAPALFVLSADNETQLVNYRVKNNYYIVDRLFGRAELRVGQKDQEIVRIINENWKNEVEDQATAFRYEKPFGFEDPSYER